MLRGKTVVLGVTGSIAAYKIANLASMLVKLQADVHVIMTKNATNFIHPITFESLTNNRCLVDTFDRNFEFHVGHVSLAKKADILMIAPASANVIGKVANGLADDMLTTTCLAATCKKILAPAMNTNMYLNPLVQENIRKCKELGMELIDADSGYLACGDTGVGKMPSEEVLLDHILRELSFEKDMKGLQVLVTAGPTRENIDPVRFVSNRSSGKMGYAIAKACMLRGAKVTLVSGPTSLTPPRFVTTIAVENAFDMYQAVKERCQTQDIIIKSAAVADYTPIQCFEEKVKKKDGEFSIECKRTKDILAYLGETKKNNQFICGFSMETQDLIANSKEKLMKKKIDMIIANHLKVKGAGFSVDTNQVTILTKDDILELPLLTKEETAHRILDAILNKR